MGVHRPRSPGSCRARAPRSTTDWCDLPPDHSAVELAESDSVARTPPRVRSATSRDGNAANEPRTAVMRMCMQSKGGGQQGSRGVRRGAGGPRLLGTGPRDSGPTATIACVSPATGDGGWPPPACGPGRGRCRPLWRRPSVASSPPRQRPCRRPRPSPAPSVCTRGGPEHSAAIHPSPSWPSGSRSRRRRPRDLSELQPRPHPPCAGRRSTSREPLRRHRSTLRAASPEVSAADP